MTELHDLILGVQASGAKGIRLVDAQFASTRDNGVNLYYQNQLITDVAVLGSYVPTSGDTVACLIVGNRWLVLGAIRAYNPADGQSTNLSWSTTAPVGTGWHKSKSGDVYVKVDDSGNNKIHVVRDAADADPDPVNSASDSEWFQPVDIVDYQNGRQTTYLGGNVPIQGHWDGQPANTGLVTYGTQIMDYCAGRTCVDIAMEIERSDSGGIYDGVPMHLWLAAPGTAPAKTPNITNGWIPHDGKGNTILLDPGQSLRGPDAFSFPSTQRDSLATGASKAVAFFTTVVDDYMVFTRNIGRIKVTVE